MTGVHLVGYFPSKIKNKRGIWNRLAPTSSGYRLLANSLPLVPPYFKCDGMEKMVVTQNGHKKAKMNLNKTLFKKKNRYTIARRDR